MPSAGRRLASINKENVKVAKTTKQISLFFSGVTNPESSSIQYVDSAKQPMTSRKVLVLAVITEVLDTTITYPACVRCYSKLLVDPTTNRYHCVKCGTSCTQCKVQWRYKLVVCVSDKTCLGRVVIFGRCLDGFFGKTATDFTRSLDDLEWTGYPAKSMLSEALLRTFLGKYFYFGFKATDTCDTDHTVGPTALKDVLNLDVSLPQSHFDCTSNFDNSHTLAHQMLASSDAVFATVTDHMRLIVKQLRNQSTVFSNQDVNPGDANNHSKNDKQCHIQRTLLIKPDVNPSDIKNQSNHANQAGYTSYRTLGSISGTTSFELGLDSVHFSFETSSNSKATGTTEKLETKAKKTGNSISSKTDFESFCETSSVQDRIRMASDSVDPDNSCLNDASVSMFDDDHDGYSYVSNRIELNTENITYKPCVTLSDLPVTQKLLFDSPNRSFGSNTSKKIDKELFRREILNSHAFTLDQFSCLSGTSYFHPDTCNGTVNFRKPVACPKEYTRNCDNTFNSIAGAGFLHNGTTTDAKSLSSVSILRHKLAAELAMPESEDLNAFFDSEFEGFMFTQDNEELDVDNDDLVKSPKSSSELNDNGKNELTECANFKCERGVENTVKTDSEIKEKTQDKCCNKLAECVSSDCDVVTTDKLSGGEMKKDFTCGKDNAIVKHMASESECIEHDLKIENTHEPTVAHVPDLTEPLLEKCSELDVMCRIVVEGNRDTSQKQCGNQENFPESEHFSDSFEEHFFEDELNDPEIKEFNDLEIKAVSESINQVNIDVTYIEKASSKTRSSNHGSRVVAKEESKVELEDDLELFFADISNYEIDKSETDNRNKNDKSESEDQTENVNLVDKDLDADLEEFFADISKFDIDEHEIELVARVEEDDKNVKKGFIENVGSGIHNRDNDSDGTNEPKSVMGDAVDKNIKKLFGAKVGSGIHNNDNGSESDGTNWYDYLMNSGASDLDTDKNMDSLRVADTPELEEQSPESDNDVVSDGTGSNCAGQRFKSNNDTDERSKKSGHDSGSRFHFDFLTSGSSCESSPYYYNQVNVPKKSTSLNKKDSYNGRTRNISIVKPHNSDKKCCACPLATVSEQSSGKNASIVSIYVANSFDASNDLFESSGGIGTENDSPDKCTAMDGFVSDSLNDESVWENSPLGASTPAADQCIIFDSLEELDIEIESDSEIENGNNSDEKKKVKFDKKLRRVSSCNFIDLRMRVNESPLVRQDHNRLLKSCLKLPKTLQKTIIDNRNDKGNENMTSAEKYAVKLSPSSKSVLEISNGLDSYCDGSVDLFGDSSKTSEGVIGVFELENDLKEDGRVTSPKNVSFSEHWSDDVSDNILLGAIENTDDKENSSEPKVVKCRTNNVLCNQEEKCKKSALKNCEMKTHLIKNIGLEENSWSPDIFESQTHENDIGSRLRMNNVASISDPFVKKVGPLKSKRISKENKTEGIRCTNLDKNAAVLSNNQQCVLKSLPAVLNTPDCADGLGAKNAQSDKNSEIQSNGEKIILTENQSSKINFAENQSSFYSPDLFCDSVLDPADDNVVCDRTNDVLCKKLLF